MYIYVSIYIVNHVFVLKLLAYKRGYFTVCMCIGKERLAEILDVEPSYARDLTNSFLCEYDRCLLYNN